MILRFDHLRRRVCWKRCGRVVLVALILFLCCCTSRRSVELQVTDMQNRPVPGARVSVAAMEFFVPVYPYPTLNPFGSEASRAMTDESGIARVEAPTDAPSHVSVAAEGFPPFGAILEYRGGASAEIRWQLSGQTMLPDHPALSVRIVEVP